MNFETKTVNYVNETSLGKFVNEKTDWKAFYKMAKDTSGETFKEFEKKYAKEMDRPHIKDAVKNAKDFNSFMKAISKFEE